MFNSLIIPLKKDKGKSAASSQSYALNNGGGGIAYVTHIQQANQWAGYGLAMRGNILAMTQSTSPNLKIVSWNKTTKAFTDIYTSNDFSGIVELIWSKDGSRLIARDGSGNLKLLSWNGSTLTLLDTKYIQFYNATKSVTLSPDGKWIACANTSGQILIYSFTGDTLTLVSQNSGSIGYRIAWKRDSTGIICGGYDASTRYIPVSSSGVLGTPVAWNSGYYPNYGFYIDTDLAIVFMPGYSNVFTFTPSTGTTVWSRESAYAYPPNTYSQSIVGHFCVAGANSQSPQQIIIPYKFGSGIAFSIESINTLDVNGGNSSDAIAYNDDDIIVFSWNSNSASYPGYLLVYERLYGKAA